MLIPFCEGPFLDKLNSAIRTGASFEDFQMDVINTLIPSRLYSSLKQNLYFRLQAPSEPLNIYIQSIKDRAEILRLPVEESQFVATVVEGLNPLVRSRIIFERKPKTFNENLY